MLKMQAEQTVDPDQTAPSLTLKILNIRTPKRFAVITLKFEQDGFTKE